MQTASGVPEAAALHCSGALSLLRRTDGTSICTSAALEAGLCVDYVLAITLGNCPNGTCVCTSTALDTCITDCICHNCIPPVFVFGSVVSFPYLYCIIFSEKSKPFLKKISAYFVWFRFEQILQTKIIGIFITRAISHLKRQSHSYFAGKVSNGEGVDYKKNV